MRRLGEPDESANRFLNLTDLGVPRYCGSLGRDLSSGPEVAWRFLAMPASNSTSPVTAGLSEVCVADGERGVEGALIDGLRDLISPRSLVGGL